jgi:hypothetical protein
MPRSYKRKLDRFSVGRYLPRSQSDHNIAAPQTPRVKRKVFVTVPSPTGGTDHASSVVNDIIQAMTMPWRRVTSPSSWIACEEQLPCYNTNLQRRHLRTKQYSATHATLAVLVLLLGVVRQGSWELYSSGRKGSLRGRPSRIPFSPPDRRRDDALFKQA